MKKILISILLLVVTLSACSAAVDKDHMADEKEPDEIIASSIAAFKDMANAITFEYDEKNTFYTVTSPDQQVVVSLSADIAATDPFDYKMEIDAAPFISAGLDTALLQDGVFVNNTIVLAYDLGNAGVKAHDVVQAFEAIPNIDATLVGYHAAMDHYGLSFGNGNVFEWASDFAANDKDIVFVVNPQIFIDAGVDVDAIEGWVFAKVEVMEADGTMVEVEKLLKPFNIK